MKTSIEWQNGINFIASSESGNKISMDGSVENGGKNNGARPTEVLISGMGGCTAFDIINTAKNKNIKILKFNLDIEASRTDKKPSLLNKIHLIYKIKANIKYKTEFEKMIKLSIEKQCSCCIVLSKAVDITYSLELT